MSNYLLSQEIFDELKDYILNDESWNSPERVFTWEEMQSFLFRFDPDELIKMNIQTEKNGVTKIFPVLHGFSYSIEPSDNEQYILLSDDFWKLINPAARSK